MVGREWPKGRWSSAIVELEDETVVEEEEWDSAMRDQKLCREM